MTTTAIVGSAVVGQAVVGTAAAAAASSSLFAEFMLHTVQVETYLGPGPTGDLWAAPVSVTGLYDAGLAEQKEPGGTELVERSSFYASQGDAAKFVPKSRVTYAGRTSLVQQVFMHDGGTLAQFGAISHIQVILV